MEGIVSEITSFSTRDGPGIRTTVFLKGCPLRCKWCSNPETHQQKEQLFYIGSKCQGCGKCAAVCPEGAVTNRFGRIGMIERKKCSLCMKCVAACPVKAYRISGKRYTPEALFRLIEKDKVFYGPDGGLTVSGGEALSQPEFTRELFRLCSEAGISTVLDTSGYGAWTDLERILRHCRMVLFDLKQMDPALHRQWTGVSNERILENARRIAAAVETRISLPLVAGVNDSAENLHRTADFARENGVEWIDLNPLHTLGAAKYHYLGRRSPYGKFRLLDENEVQSAVALLQTHGLNVTVGRMM